jgi:hypothetical protein
MSRMSREDLRALRLYYLAYSSAIQSERDFAYRAVKNIKKELFTRNESK